VGLEGNSKTEWDNLVNEEPGGGEETPTVPLERQTSGPASHALAHAAKPSRSLESHPPPFLTHSCATQKKHTSLTICHFLLHHPRKDAKAKVDPVALVVTGHRVCVHIRQAGRWVGGCTGTPKGIFRWARLHHAALGGVMAMDYPGAVGLGHAPLLHRRSLGEGQRTPRAVQSGALQDPGQAGAA